MVQTRWFVLSLLSVLFVACGKSPPSELVEAEVGKAVRRAVSRAIAIEGGKVVIEDIETSDWKSPEKDMQKLLGIEAQLGRWSAKLEFKEAHAFLLVEVNGKRLIRPIVGEGDELVLTGSIEAMHHEGTGEWNVNAECDGEPLKPLIAKLEDVGVSGNPLVAQKIEFEYRVLAMGQADQRPTESAGERGPLFWPLSKLQPCADESSEEAKAALASYQERVTAAQTAAAEAARERQAAEAKRREEQLARQAEERRVAEEKAAKEREQAQAAAEAARKAQAEEAARKAEEARRARLLPLLTPFRVAGGSAIVRESGVLMSRWIESSEVDESAMTVKGAGVDLSEMPFQAFTFEGRISDRGVLSLTLSSDPTALEFGRPDASGLVGAAGVKLAILSEADQARVRAHCELGRKLGTAAGVELSAEVLDAAAAKVRPAELKLEKMMGTVFFRGRSDPRLLDLFTPGPTRTNYAWKAESLYLRLPESTRAKAIFIRGSGAAIDNLLLVINGVHRIRVEAVAAQGAVVVALPPDLDLLDLKFEALGSIQSRGISLSR